MAHASEEELTGGNSSMMNSTRTLANFQAMAANATTIVAMGGAKSGMSGMAGASGSSTMSSTMGSATKKAAAGTVRAPAAAGLLAIGVVFFAM